MCCTAKFNLYLTVNHCSLLIAGVESILEGTVSSPQAKLNRELASHFLSAIHENDSSKYFAIELVSQLAVFTTMRNDCVKWGDYHNYRSTSTYSAMWLEFVQKLTGKTPHPTFYQHTTHHILKSLIKLRKGLETSVLLH